MPPAQCFYDPQLQIVLLYSTFQCKNDARAPGSHKTYIPTRRGGGGGRNRIDPAKVTRTRRVGTTKWNQFCSNKFSRKNMHCLFAAVASMCIFSDATQVHFSQSSGTGGQSSAAELCTDHPDAPGSQQG